MRKTFFTPHASWPCLRHLVAAALLAAPAAWAGGVFRVDCDTPGSGDWANPSVAALPGGRFVAAWQDNTSNADADVFGRIADAGGGGACASNGAFRINLAMTGPQWLPQVAALAGGDYFVVTWDDRGDIFDHQVKARVYQGDGTPYGTEFIVNTTAASQQDGPGVAALIGGGFVIAWGDLSGTGADTSDYAVRAQRFGADGAPSGDEFLVNTTTAGAQARPRLAGLAGGGFVVVWQDGSQAGGDDDAYAVRAQVFEADGAPRGGEFLVNTITAGGQSVPSVAALAGGGFVVAWQDDSGSTDDPEGGAVRAQVFDAGGHRQGAEFLVNTLTEGTQGDPGVAALPGGGFVIAWRHGSEDPAGAAAVRAQVFDAGGHKRGGEFLVSDAGATGRQWFPSVASLDDGTFVVAWQGEAAADLFKIDARVFMAPPTLQLDPASDTGAAGDGITTETLPTFTGTAKPGSTVTLLDDGAPLGTATADGDGRWNFTPASPLAPGRHALTASAADAADGESAPAPLVLTIGGGPAAPVPTLGQWALVVLAALTAALGLRRPSLRKT